MTMTRQPDNQVRTPLPPPRVTRYRVEPEPRSRISSAIIYIVVAALITAVGLLYLIQTNHVAGLGYEMSQLQRERNALSLRNEQLNYQVARYESLASVESVAIGQVGMVPSGEHLFLTVPRPASSQLELPEARTGGNPSVFERIWRGISGKASAVSPAGESDR